MNRTFALVFVVVELAGAVWSIVHNYRVVSDSKNRARNGG